MTALRLLTIAGIGILWVAALAFLGACIAELATSRGWPKPGRICPICGQPDDLTHRTRHGEYYL